MAVVRCQRVQGATRHHGRCDIFEVTHIWLFIAVDVVEVVFAHAKLVELSAGGDGFITSCSSSVCHDTAVCARSYLRHAAAAAQKPDTM